MKAAQLRDWVKELLTAHGAKVETRGAHLLELELDGELAERIGSKGLALAFTQRGLQENPRSELATVGNPVFDRVLELAESTGRWGVRYERVLARKKRVDPLKAVQLTNGARGFSEPRVLYTPLYHALFRVRTSVEEVPDELEVICVDGLTRSAEPFSDDFLDFWGGLQSEPETGTGSLDPFPVPEEVLTQALVTLEHRLGRRLSRLRRTSQEHLAQERENIGTYYETLIEEAKTAPLRGGRGPESRAEKERILKLDWKRRVEEAQGFWSPRVDVTISAVAVVMKPRWAFALQGESGGSVFADLETGQFLIPAGVAGVRLVNS